MGETRPFARMSLAELGELSLLEHREERRRWMYGQRGRIRDRDLVHRLLPSDSLRRTKFGEVVEAGVVHSQSSDRVPPAVGFEATQDRE